MRGNDGACPSPRSSSQCTPMKWKKSGRRRCRKAPRSRSFGTASGVSSRERSAGFRGTVCIRRFSGLSLFKDEHIEGLLASGLDKVGATKAAAKNFLLLKKKDPAAAKWYAERAKEMNELLDALI